MKVESIAECSLWSILQYFRLALSNHWSRKPVFGLFSVCFTQVYVHSSVAIILMGKRELVALLSLSSW